MNSIRARFEKIAARAAKAGFPDPQNLMRLTPREMEWALEAFAAEKRRELELAHPRGEGVPHPQHAGGGPGAGRRGGVVRGAIRRAGAERTGPVSLRAGRPDSGFRRDDECGNAAGV